MHSIHQHFLKGPNRYSAKKMKKPTPFVCSAPEAQSGFILGDFNDWDPEAHPMKRQKDGAWRLEIPLHHGPHHYLFLIHGRATLDPRAQGIARNKMDQKASSISVS